MSSSLVNKFVNFDQPKNYFILKAQSIDNSKALIPKSFNDT